MDTHEDVILRLGGYIHLAKVFDTNPSVTWKWTRLGIPFERWPRVLEIAQERGVELTADDLLKSFPGLSVHSKRGAR